MPHRIRLSALAAAFALFGAVHAEPTPWPSSYKFQDHAFTNPNDSGRCGKAENATAKIGKIRFAQTHLLELSSPFFYLAGERPALIAINLDGSGKAPDVRLTAKIYDEPVGTACLAGPSEIPAAGSDSIPSLDKFYSMTLPKEWMKPGLSVDLQVGSQVTSLTARQLSVKSPTNVSLLIANLEILDLEKSKSFAAPSSNFLANLAAALPASVTRVGYLPVTIPFDKYLFWGGKDWVLACSESVEDRKDCLPDTRGLGVESMKYDVLRYMDLFHQTFGMSYAGGYSYGQIKMGWGGIADASSSGGGHSIGFGLDNTFIHELGHTIGLPHPHETYNTKYQEDDQFLRWQSIYPYGGPKGDGGGRGTTWNWDQNSREFISPNCEDPYSDYYGLERKDVMSYNGYECPELRRGGAKPWIGFSDFSATMMHEFLHGNSGYRSGTIMDRDTLRSYQLPKRFGMTTLQLDENGKRIQVRGETQPKDRNDQMIFFRSDDVFIPSHPDTSVYLVYGSFHPKLEFANIVYKPLAFRGWLSDLVDPTDPKIFAELKSPCDGNKACEFWVPRDFTFRFTYDDGTRRVALDPYEWTIRDSAHYNNLHRFAILIPADKPLVKVEMFRRPFLSSSPDDTSEGNIKRPNDTTTAANFMDAATLLFERSFDDVAPVTNIAARPAPNADIESLGGQVTVRDLTGRVQNSFTLEAGASLDRGVRQHLKNSGIWLIQLRNQSGSLSRTIAIQ